MTPPSPVPGRVERARAKAARARRRRPLSLDAIVDVALRIVDEEGTEAVSMRRVAAEFDTGPASLYAYVANKDELLRCVLDRIIEEIVVPEGDTWQEVVRGFAFQTRSDLPAAQRRRPAQLRPHPERHRHARGHRARARAR